MPLLAGQSAGSPMLSYRHWVKHRRLYLSPHLGFKSEIGLGSRAYQSFKHGEKRFWELLAFTMQMCLIMNDRVHSGLLPSCSTLMNGISGGPIRKKPWQGYCHDVSFFNDCGMVQLGTSLIASAMLALFIVKRNPKVDYRLLIAAAYLGLAAPGTPACQDHHPSGGDADNFVIKAKLLDGVIPISQTILHPFNLILTLIIVVVVTILMALMHPRPEKAFTVSPQLMDQLKLYEAPPKPTKFESPSDWD